MSILRKDRLAELQQRVTDFNSFAEPLDVNSDFLEPMLKHGASVLACAIFWGACKCVNFAIGNMTIPLPTILDHANRNLLHFAAASKGLQMYKIISERVSDVEAVDADRFGVVHFAAQHGNLDVLKYLYTENVDFKVTTGEGDTALHFAVDGLFSDVVEFLVKNGCDVAARNRAGILPLMRLKFRIRETLKVLNIFLDNGFDIDMDITGDGEFRQIRNLGPTLLWFFFWKREERLMELLLEEGADPNVRNAEGFLISDLAAQENLANIYQTLMKYT